MPSPLTHTLAGLVVHRLKRSREAPPAAGRSALGLAALAAVAANAPDLDFIPGLLLGAPWLFHRGPSHSLAALAVVMAVTYVIARAVGQARAGQVAGLVGVAYGSHLLLDMSPVNPHPKYGVPLFWPFFPYPVVLPFRLFLEIDRDRSGQAGGFIQSLLIEHNVYAIGREVLVMLVLALAWWGGRRVLAQLRGEPGRRSHVGTE